MSGASTPHYRVLQNLLAENGGAALIGESGGGTVESVLTAIEAALPLKAALASPAFTGTPTAPTQSPGDNSTKLSTTAYVEAAIAALVSSSPAALDTLNELAAALGDDPNFATTMTNALAAKAPLASPAFTGNPTVPTQSPGNNSTRIASTAFVQAAVSAGSGAGRVVLSTAELSADSAVDFSGLFNSIYSHYSIEFVSVKPSVSTGIYIRTSTDGGTTFDAGATDYDFSQIYRIGETLAGNSGSASGMTIGDNISSAAEGLNGRVDIFDPLNSALKTSIKTAVSYENGSSLKAILSGYWRRNVAADVDAVRVYPAAGNLASGKLILIGYLK